MKKRRILSLLVLPMVISCALKERYFHAQNEPGRIKELSRLIEYIQSGNVEAPMLVFREYDRDFNPSVHRANLEYFEQHPDLLDKIRNTLGAEKLHWELESFNHRLMFAPETRKHFTKLYKAYCNGVINYAMERLRFQNPYSRFMDLHQEIPETSAISDGITAFLVHDLAIEYRYTYGFFNSSQKKVKIELLQTVNIGEVGSYTSYLSLAHNKSIDFLKSGFTIWQNNAGNPYTALMVPMEETFHIILRDPTQRAIKLEFPSDDSPDMGKVRHAVEEWISVEEAIVGGLVYTLLPEFLRRQAPEFQDVWVEADLNVKSGMQNYKYLRQGIRVVEELGIENALNLYRKNPHAFRELLI